MPRPTPGPGQVVIRVEGAGFCHSDLHIIGGEIRILPHTPHILGHETVGAVSDVGPGVTAVKEGDRVAVYGGWGDGFCDYCAAGEENLCPAMQWVGLSHYEGGGRVVQVGLAGGTAHLTALKTVKPEVSMSVSWWGNIRELREVPLEFWLLEKINDVYERVKQGQVAGRAVMTP